MGHRLRLEEFEAAQPLDRSAENPSREAEQTAVQSAEVLEKARLEGYEKGYREGWDDATRAEIDEQSRIGTEFARNLQDLGFTFQEARSHVMHALEPLLMGMVNRFLPDLISRTIGQTILDELIPLAASAADQPIEIVLSPQSRPAIEPLLTSAKGTPFTLIEEPTLAEGQIFLRSGTNEREIDFTRAIDQIGTAINGLYELNEKAFQNGRSQQAS